MQNKIKIIDDNLSFILVNDPLLDQFLDYLSKNLKWDNDSKKNIKNFIVHSNMNLKYYGMAILDRKKIVGGIMVIDQGVLKSNKSELKVINISNLFINKSKRNISFKFLIEFNKLVEEYIVTDYTSSEKTIKILSYLNFKIANTFSYRLTFFNVLEFRKFLFNFEKVFIEYNQSQHYQSNPVKNKMKYIKYFSNGGKLVLVLSRSFIKTRFIFFTFKLKKIRILSVNNNFLFKKNYLQIIIYLMIKNLSPIIYIDCLNNNLTKKYLSIKSIKKHLIKNKNGSSNEIPPQGSEISIIH